MNRRGFLSLLGQAAVGSVVAYSFPSIIVPKNIQPVYSMAPHGLAYLINDQSRILQGLNTTVFPDLNSPVVDLGGAVLSPEMFDYAKKYLNAMLMRTSSNSMLYP